MTVAALKKDIQIQAGRTFSRSYRAGKGDGTYYSWSAGEIKFYNKYGTTGASQLSGSVAVDTDGNITITVTDTATGAITDPDSGDDEPLQRRWAWYEVNCTETTTGRVIGIFYGQVNLLRELGASA